MALTGLSQFTPEQYQETIKDKDPIKVRIALFYDGTLNNRVNIAEREKRELDMKLELELKDFHKYSKGDSNSYNNGRTNIAIMEPHLLETAEGYDVFLKVYIEGQGTFDLEGDSLRGYALGGGASGVADRANAGIERAVKLIKGSNAIKSTHYIQKLTLDVFGFSRGAATARYAIHVILNGRGPSVDEFTGKPLYQWEPIFERLINRDYVINKAAVEIGFAGLYDTVLSYYGSQLFKWTNNVLEQKSVARAKKALHLAAADEHRSDFPLHRISSAVDAGIGEEYYLPGVHSDVGGSYNLANEKELLAQADEQKRKYMRTSNEGIPEGMSVADATAYVGLVLYEHSDRARLDQDRIDLIAQGWYLEHQIKVTATDWDDNGNPTKYALCVKRPGIRSAYCNIPLKIMAKYARGKDVKLNVDGKLDDRADLILGKEPDLVRFEKEIEKYMDGNKNSKAKDWTCDEEQIRDPKLKDIRKDLKAIRNRHFHFSSKPGMGYSPNFYFDHAAGKYRRTRYEYNDNQDDKA